MTLRILCVGTVTTTGEVELVVKPPTKQDSLMLAAIAFGRQLHGDGAERSECRNLYETAGYDEAEAELEAVIDEVFGKPGLGVEDSAGLPDIDHDAELEEQREGREDDDWHRGGRW